MQIGQLNRRIQLQEPTRVEDGMGGYSTTFATAFSVWARAWSVSSTEIMTDMMVNMVRVQKFCIRYRSDVKPDWRVKYDSRYFAITSIDPDEKNEFIYLTVKEVVGV